MDNSERYVETIKYLVKLFEYFNQNLFNGELKKPVITIAPDMKNKESGWTSQSEVWKASDNKEEASYELNVSAVFLNKEMTEISAILLHEMCHLYAKVKGLKETSRNGKYHNKLFRRIAVTHGLLVKTTERKGYSQTSLNDSTVGLLDKFIENNKLSSIYRLPVIKGKSVNKVSARKYVCSICGNSVRATKEINVLCVDCNNLMTEEKL